jgi:hypothetical protein
MTRRREVGLAQIRGGPELVDLEVPVDVREVRVDEVVRPKARIERDRQESALAAAIDAIADVEERLGANGPVVDHTDPPALLDDVEDPGRARGVRHVDGLVERPDVSQRQVRSSGRCPSSDQHENHGKRGRDRRDHEQRVTPMTPDSHHSIHITPGSTAWFRFAVRSG